MSLAAVVAAHGMPTQGSLPDEPLSDDAWAALLSAVVRERIPGLLASAIADGALTVTDEQFAEALGVHQTAMEVALLLDRALVRASTALAAEGIAHRALKGASFAHLDYPDPALRAYGDVDLLVPSATLDEAVGCLTRLGHERRHPPLRPDFEARFAKTVELVGPVEIDLHRTLALEPFGWWIDEADLFAAPTAFTVGGTAVPAPSTAVRFLHACYHAALGNRPPRLAPLRDLAQMALSATFDWREAVATAGRWRGLAVVGHAVRTAREVLRLDVDGGIWRWARHHRPSVPESRALEVYVSGSRSQTERLLRSILVLPTWRARWSYLRAVALPDRAYLAARGLERAEWWQRGRRATRELGRRGR